MTVTLYEITIPVFIKHLTTLSKLLEKGVAFTKEDGAKISEAQLVESKLIEDMGDLVYQSLSLPLLKPFPQLFQKSFYLTMLFMAKGE